MPKISSPQVTGEERSSRSTAKARIPSPMPPAMIATTKSEREPESFKLDTHDEGSEDVRQESDDGEREAEFEAGKDPSLLSDDEKNELIRRMQGQLYKEHEEQDVHPGSARRGPRRTPQGRRVSRRFFAPGWRGCGQAFAPQIHGALSSR